MEIENVTTVEVNQGAPVRRASASAWSRFVDANKQFCRRRLQPRLYPVTHMTALACWFDRRIKPCPAGSILEFGCGHTLPLTHLLGSRFGRRYATDVDDVPAGLIPEGVHFERCSPDVIPFADAQFDCVVIRSVIEHVEHPERTFAELHRITKPGGRVLMNLPNKWDYVSVIARLLGPFKSPVLKTMVRTQWDDFPVVYRCNTRAALSEVAARTGFDVVEFMPLPSQPSYLSFFVPLYVLGAVYQFVVSILGLDVLQPSFIVILQKRPVRSLGSQEVA